MAKLKKDGVKVQSYITKIKGGKMKKNRKYQSYRTGKRAKKGFGQHYWEMPELDMKKLKKKVFGSDFGNFGIESGVCSHCNTSGKVIDHPYYGKICHVCWNIETSNVGKEFESSKKKVFGSSPEHIGEYVLFQDSITNGWWVHQYGSHELAKLFKTKKEAIKWIESKKDEEFIGPREPYLLEKDGELYGPNGKVSKKSFSSHPQTGDTSQKEAQEILFERLKAMNYPAIKFFIKRFNRQPEHDSTYFKEWVDRFRRGEEWEFADRESRKVLKELDPQRYRRKEGFEKY